MYRKYFDIDPDYFPAVNADVIKKNPDLWKKFYPHDTFVKLVKDVVSVLSRKQKLNIWVEGAYGTGKSHAVLTLKHLLDASIEDTLSYFKQFSAKFGDDLCNKFIAEKECGKIITVHRYGSSSIHNDNDLFIAMQESIESALKAAGINNQGTDALKKAVVKYLSDEENKQSFGVYVSGSYSTLFGGESVDDIIDHLNNYKDQALHELMGKIFKLANEKNIKALTLDSADMKEWIRSIIETNDLHALIFIWDEFTEYFNNNQHRLTGYQEILELSSTAPFCFIPVTHKSDALISDNDSEKSKIIGRFVKPYCLISLPENMAFQLMGAAMKKKEDDVILKEWEETLVDLRDRTCESRRLVKAEANINDAELEGILPIHPYAACLLKHIASSFDSNQRSMFDFIKNDRGNDIKGFQWFIDNCDPLDENPLLTVDMLWGFFYDMGRESLSQKIRMILDYYPRFSKNRNSDECRVLKAVLLFQALSLEMGDSVDIFLPTDKNLNNAFEGSDLDNASHVADKLVRENVLYKRKINSSLEVYSVLTGSMDSDEIEKHKKRFEAYSTSSLITEGKLDECIELTSSLRLRYKIDYAGLFDFDAKVKKLIDLAENDDKHIYALVSFAKDDDESAAIKKKIQSYSGNNIVIIDCSNSKLGKEDFDEWVENKATSSYYTGKDNAQSNTYNRNATKVLEKWCERIKSGQFIVYTSSTPSGDVVNNIDILVKTLLNLDLKRFPDGLERYTLIDNMWKSVSLKQGVGCGLEESLAGTYRSSNQNTNIENHLKGAWNVKNYWQSSPSLSISKTKIAVDKLVETKMTQNGRISIREIYELLKDAPYGYMPCNITALVIGFLMKEHINEGQYTWSDGISSDELTQERFKEMVEEIIKHDNTPNPRYKDKYIVTVSDEMRSFFNVTSVAFDINKSFCSSVESARDYVRTKMKAMSFPLWTLKWIIASEPLKTSKEVIKKVIDLYCQFVNNVSSETGKSDNDIASDIGKLCLSNPDVASDLKSIFTADKCTEGMRCYIDEYRNGQLVTLAKSINDGNQYINAVREKFNADAANWVWKRETADQQIDSVILEYEIVAESNKIIETTKSYKSAISAWNEKCANLRLSYNIVKSTVGELDNLLGLLYNLRVSGSIQENQKSTFLECLRSYGNDFKSLYANQIAFFKKSCSFYLDGLSDTDIDQIFRKLPSNCFTLDKSSYTTQVDEQVNSYKQQLGAQKLKELWLDKTKTKTPYEWSNIHKMPILVMIDDAHVSEYRQAFTTINNPHPEEKKIEMAMQLLEKSNIWDALNSASERDKAFRDKIIGENSVMLDDVESVRHYLADHIPERPYEWYMPTVTKMINNLAEQKYLTQAHQQAFKKIDEMSAEDAKEYLKELVKNNFKVGIEIIKNN